jgi:ABC-type iron transport system FetAB ATPase subunit
MTKIDIHVESPVPKSARIAQLGGMFDLPKYEKSKLEWHGEVSLDFDWNVGLIVGPSGSGKTTLARELFGESVDQHFAWSSGAVVDDFSGDYSMQEIAEICQAVGFNTIPAWIRPFHVLSNGEQFRVKLARQLLEGQPPIVVDEFTSVVDRQVAQIGAHAVQKYARRRNVQFVGISCHYDIVDWLNPDWVIEMPQMALERRSLRPRPKLDIAISPVPYAAWHTFKDFHYLTNELHKGAQCYALFVNGRIASFAGLLHRPHPRSRDITGVSRLVTLPDWQGLGLAFVLVDTLGAAHKAIGRRLHTYPAHPALIHGFDKSANWTLIQRPGGGSPRSSTTTLEGSRKYAYNPSGAHRATAVFSYVGAEMDIKEAERLLARTKETRLVDLHASTRQLKRSRR